MQKARQKLASLKGWEVLGEMPSGTVSAASTIRAGRRHDATQFTSEDVTCPRPQGSDHGQPFSTAETVLENKRSLMGNKEPRSRGPSEIRQEGRQPQGSLLRS